MKREKTIKLSLNKNTVAHLSNLEMSNHRGGLETIETCGSVCKSQAATWCTCPGIGQCMLPSKNNWTCSGGTNLLSICVC